MHNCTACEIKGTKVAQPSACAPYPVRYRIINKGRPEKSENHECTELYAFNECTCYQRDRDHCKHCLEYHKSQCRYCGCISSIGILTHTIESYPVKVADYASYIRTESEAVTKKYPLSANQCENCKAEHYS